MSSTDVAILLVDFIRQSSDRDCKLQRTLKQLETLVLDPRDDVVPAPEPAESSDPEDKDVDGCGCVSKYAVLTNLPTFTGYERQHEARSWLSSVDFQREKHNWTEAFTIEVARSLLTEDAAAWAEIASDKLTTWPRFKIEFGNEFCGKPKRTAEKPICSVECMARSMCRWEDSSLESKEASVNRVGMTIDAFTDRYHKLRGERVARRKRKNEEKRVRHEERIERKERSETIMMRKKDNVAAVDEDNEKKTVN